MGAMENAGCVTLRDEYLPRSRQDRVVLRVPRQRDPARDGAHVVRRPGDHEVVGRPLAQRVVRRVGLLPRRGRGHRVRPRPGPASPTPARTGPTARTSCPAPTRSPPTTSTSRRSRSTSTASPTPRAPRCSSSWSPGSAWTSSSPACAPTSSGTRSATPSSPTCSPRWRSPRAASSASWAQEWLQTSGVNTLAAGVRARRRRHATRRSPSRQTAHPDYPTLRRHRLGVGLYDRASTAAWSAVRPSRSTSPASAPRSPSWSASSSPTCCCSTTAT